jgi:hypothetical protein
MRKEYFSAKECFGQRKRFDAEEMFWGGRNVLVGKKRSGAEDV